MHLLSDPLIPVHVEPADHVSLVSLADLFAGWSRGEDLALLGMRAHQRPAVECALAQFAAHALELAAKPFGAYSAPQWQGMLQALADHEGAPQFWELALEDRSSAAFMQPALTPEVAALKPFANPGELDALVLSKNHDVKQDSLEVPSAWHWVCALITAQTTSRYGGRSLISSTGGRSYYGVMRMNGGYGTRAFFAAYTTYTARGRWSEDVRRLLAIWAASHQDNAFGYRFDGVRLLAARVWDGVTGCRLSELHPGVVEVCRAVRLSLDASGALCGAKDGTQAERIAGADALRGVTGDPWTPLARDAKGLKALSADSQGLTLRAFLELVFSEDRALQSPFARAIDTRGPVTVSLAGLGGGKSATSGYHEHVVVVPPRTANLLFGTAAEPSQREALLRLKANALELYNRLRRRTEWAYCVAQQPLDATQEAIRDTTKSPHHAAVVTAMRQELDAGWQHALLPWLCAAVEHNEAPEAALQRWFRMCRRQALDALRRHVAPNHGAARSSALRHAKALCCIPARLEQLA